MFCRHLMTPYCGYSYKLPDFVRVVKQRTLLRAGRWQWMGKAKSACRILAGDQLGKRQLARPRWRQDNIKIYTRDLDEFFVFLNFTCYFCVVNFVVIFSLFYLFLLLFLSYSGSTFFIHHTFFVCFNLQPNKKKSQRACLQRKQPCLSCKSILCGRGSETLSSALHYMNFNNFYVPTVTMQTKILQKQISH